MRKIAADYKQILVSKIRFQHIGHPFKFVVVVGRNDDRHYWGHFAQFALQKWQLHLQTMLLRMSRTVIGENAISLSQFDSCFVVHFYIAKWCGVIVGLGVYRCTIKPFVMAGT